MSDILFQLLLIGIILAYLIWRLVYSPKFTNLALHRFICDSLSRKRYADLMTSHNEKITVRNRSAYAHWKSHKGGHDKGYVIEFQVHPSIVPISISASVFIHIRDAAHFEQIKKGIITTDDYTPFLASDEVVDRIVSG